VASERGSRLLVLAPFPPRLDGLHGGSRAMAQLLSQLALRHPMALVVLRASHEPEVDPLLKERCEIVEEVLVPPPGRSLPARVRRRLAVRGALLRGIPTWATEGMSPAFGPRVEDVVRRFEPDLVKLEYSIMGRAVPALAGSGAPRVLTEYDAGAMVTSNLPLLARLLEARVWKRFEQRVIRRVDALIVLTERDRAQIAPLAGATPVVTIPIGMVVPAQPLDPRGSGHSIVYIGSYIHAPNVDAAVRLARRIFPVIRERVPDAELTLVGSHATQTIRRLRGGGVVVAGQVPDVTPYLDAAAVVTTPIQMGGGMRVKVLEALAAGKALVATRLATEGLDVTSGEELLLAETDEELAEAIVSLLLDEERRVALAQSARRWAETHLDWDAVVRAHEELYASVIAAKR
jgi:glycosyltransferase involved in cell wall biosynthesis